MLGLDFDRLGYARTTQIDPGAQTDDGSSARGRLPSWVRRDVGCRRPPARDGGSHLSVMSVGHRCRVGARGRGGSSRLRARPRFEDMRDLALVPPDRGYRKSVANTPLVSFGRCPTASPIHGVVARIPLRVARRFAGRAPGASGCRMAWRGEAWRGERRHASVAERRIAQRRQRPYLLLLTKGPPCTRQRTIYPRTRAPRPSSC